MPCAWEPAVRVAILGPILSRNPVARGTLRYNAFVPTRTSPFTTSVKGSETQCRVEGCYYQNAATGRFMVHRQLNGYWLEAFLWYPWRRLTRTGLLGELSKTCRIQRELHERKGPCYRTCSKNGNERPERRASAGKRARWCSQTRFYGRVWNFPACHS